MSYTMDIEVKPEAAKKVRFKWTFLHELKEELQKVSWTSKEELLIATKVVVGATFAFGLGIYIIDLIVKGVLNSFTLFTHWLGG